MCSVLVSAYELTKEVYSCVKVLVSAHGLKIKVTGFSSLKGSDRVNPVVTINADFAKKLTRRLHQDPLLWPLEKGILSMTCSWIKERGIFMC